MEEYKKSHVELKYDMLVLQKYLLLILKICNISAEELANKIGVTDHLIRNFMSDPVRAIMPRTTFISIMSILEIEMKRNENGFLLRLLFNNIFNINAYYETKKLYESDLVFLRSKSKKVLTKATDTKELNSLDIINSLNFIQSYSDAKSYFDALSPDSYELTKKIEAMDETADASELQDIQQIIQELLAYISNNFDSLEEVFKDFTLENAEKIFDEYNKKYQDLYLKACKNILPKYLPEEEISEDLIKNSLPIEKIQNPFKDSRTEDGFPIWLDLIYSVEKIDDKLNQEIDNLVLSEKKLDEALEKLFLYNGLD